MANYSSSERAHLLILAILLVFLNSLVIVASLSYSKKCATLYTEQNYSGRPYSLGDGDQQPSLRQLNFLPSSVQVSQGCFLRVFDVYGYNETMDKDRSSLGWNSYRMLDAACCECGACSGAADKLGESLCARLYENPRCDGCSGFRLDFKNGNAARNLGVLKNRMTSIAVRDGCTLTVFSEPEFAGWRANFTGPNNMMGDNWFRQISSAKCGCDDVDQPWRPPTTPAPTTTTQRSPPTITYFTTMKTTTTPLTTTSTTTRSTTTSSSEPPRTESYEVFPETVEEETEEKGEDDWYGETNSDEILATTTTTTTTTTTSTTTTTTEKPTTSSSQRVEVHGFEDEDEEEEEPEEEEEVEESAEDEWPEW